VGYDNFHELQLLRRFIMKKNHVFILGLGFYFLLTSACSGNSLVSEIEVDANGSASESIDQMVTVAAVHSGAPDDAGMYPDYLTEDGTKVFQNDLGYTITLEKAGISWEHLHLISEGDGEDCVAGNDVGIDLMRVENFLDDDASPLILATVSIVDAAYCQYEIHLSAENEESAGVDDFSELLGHTVYAAGSWRHDAESGTFEIVVDEEIEVEGVFEGGLSESTASITFSIYYDRFFDGVDFLESEEELQAALAANVMAAIQP
jgi:hypothetical protein